MRVSDAAKHMSWRLARWNRYRVCLNSGRLGVAAGCFLQSFYYLLEHGDFSFKVIHPVGHDATAALGSACSIQEGNADFIVRTPLDFGAKALTLDRDGQGQNVGAHRRAGEF